MTAATGFGSYVGGQLRRPLALVGGFARMSALTGKVSLPRADGMA